MIAHVDESPKARTPMGPEISLRAGHSSSLILTNGKARLMMILPNASPCPDCFAVRLPEFHVAITVNLLPYAMRESTLIFESVRNARLRVH